MSKILTIRSPSQVDYCPACGRETEKNDYPVRSALIDGEQVPVKYNTEVSCPEHGTIVVR